MLKQRLLTALVLIPLVLGGILGLPTREFSLILAAVICAGSWEWARLSGMSNSWSRLTYAIVVAGCVIVLLAAIRDARVVYWILAAAVLWWLYGIGLVLRYRGESPGHDGQVLYKSAIGIVVLVPTWLALTVLHGSGVVGPQLVLFLMLLIWTADSGAYFVGRRWGANKLAPKVSPGKTWEGAGGAFAFTAVLAVGGGVWLHKTGFNLAIFVVVCWVTVIFSIVGDLIESLFKRQAGVKDSGTLLPGHGGVLDRIDSMTAAAPVFTLGLWLSETAF